MTDNLTDGLLVEVPFRMLLLISLLGAKHCQGKPASTIVSWSLSRLACEQGKAVTKLVTQLNCCFANEGRAVLRGECTACIGWSHRTLALLGQALDLALS
eukprot:3866280-Amphidinium_carterae.1